MAEYIDRQELIQSMAYNFRQGVWEGCDCDEYRIVEDTILEAPAAEVEEVKHGEWKRRGQEIYCSVCGNESAYNPFGASKFSRRCPSCGAKMDGKQVTE